MNKKYILLLPFIFVALHALLLNYTYAQNRTKLIGKAEQAGIIIGQGKNIKSVHLNNNKIALDAAGNFVIAFDRDDTGKVHLEITFVDNTTENFEFIIQEREFEIDRIDGMKQSFVTPPESLKQRIAKESNIIAEQKKKLANTKIAWFTTGFALPINDKEVTSVFGGVRILNGVTKEPHNGVDFRADIGDTVKAAADGIVILAENKFFYSGTFIVVDHGLGLNTTYMHLSKLNVKRGAVVKKGQVIGFAGSTGRSTGSHLHWSAQLFKKRIDPLNLLKLGM